MRMILLIPVLWALRVMAQPELEPWGNLDGIRVKGQLMEFGTSIRVVRADGSVAATAKERQMPRYSRNGPMQNVQTQIDSLYFTEEVQDVGEGSARIVVR